MIRYIVFLLLSLGSTVSLMGQDSKHIRILPFDDEAFNNRLKDYNLNLLDSTVRKNEVVPMKDKTNYTMLWAEVHEEDMAPMPKMKIDEDLHFTMRIKKYELRNPNARPKPILKNKKLPEPIKKPD